MDFESIAAYLAGECSQAEKQAIEHWRRESSQNEQHFQRWQLIWQASKNSNQNFKLDTAKAWQKINPETAAPKPSKEVLPELPTRDKNLFVWIRNIAAMLVLAVGLGWGIWHIQDQNEEQTTRWVENRTAQDRRDEVLLPDGTKIWLNAQSKVRYPEKFSAHTREVYLEGEAYFEVAHDPQQPFLIHTQNTITEVLGTTFNIRSYRDEPKLEVYLVSGKVSFSKKNAQTDQKTILRPGQKAIFTKTNQTIAVLENENQNNLAWKTGKMVFQDIALSEALQILETYYQVDFTVSDTLLLNCRFTGSFNRAPLEDVLQTFSFGSDISYHKLGNQYVLEGAGCK